jgi:hypothetical protein
VFSIGSPPSPGNSTPANLYVPDAVRVTERNRSD